MLFSDLSTNIPNMIQGAGKKERKKKKPSRNPRRAGLNGDPRTLVVGAESRIRILETQNCVEKDQKGNMQFWIWRLALKKKRNQGPLNMSDPKQC